MFRNGLAGWLQSGRHPVSPPILQLQRLIEPPVSGCRTCKSNHLSDNGKVSEQERGEGGKRGGEEGGLCVQVLQSNEVFTLQSC